MSPSKACNVSTTVDTIQVPQCTDLYCIDNRRYITGTLVYWLVLYRQSSIQYRYLIVLACIVSTIVDTIQVPWCTGVYCIDDRRYNTGMISIIVDRVIDPKQVLTCICVDNRRYNASKEIHFMHGLNDHWYNTSREVPYMYCIDDHWHNTLREVTSMHCIMDYINYHQYNTSKVSCMYYVDNCWYNTCQ